MGTPRPTRILASFGLTAHVRVPHQPQEVHAWDQDGLRRHQEGEGTRGPHLVPQRRVRALWSCSEQHFMITTLTISADRYSAAEVSLSFNFGPVGDPLGEF